MKLKTKLYLAFGCLIGLFIVLHFLLMIMMNQLNKDMEDIVKNYEMLDLASTITEEMNIYSRESRGLIANPPEELKTELQTNREKAFENINEALDSLQKLDSHEQSQELVQKLQSLSNIYNGMNREIDALLKEGKDEQIMQIYWHDSGREVREEMDKVSDKLQTIKKQAVYKELNHSNKTYNLANKLIFVYVIVSLLVGIGAIMFILRGVISNLNKVTSIMTKVAYGRADRLPRIEITSKDEIGEIALAFNEMALTLEEHSMQEKVLKNAAEEQSWLKTRIAEIATMYSGIDDLETLAHQFMIKVTPMVGANYGVFYIKQGNGKEVSLKKLATYAYDHERIGADCFQLGEGLVGQCALENRMILLKEVPKGHIKIYSGIGSASASDILIIPAEFEGEVLAVIELASFKSFSDLEQLLLKELMSNLGTYITSILRHMQVERLLQESQVFSEELQSQSEELQLQQEELRVINEQLEQQYKKSKEDNRMIGKEKEI
ncbi:GAF domain-containing protein [Metabacillus fastidiosus]|uniref:GAF domain-containing protein n=1 Tax=Metabacillus fastidiosus TaxID=1458 RepID=UPI003D29F181